MLQERAAKRVALEMQRAEEVRGTQRHEIAKLEQYMSSIQAKLEVVCEARVRVRTSVSTWPRYRRSLKYRVRLG